MSAVRLTADAAEIWVDAMGVSGYRKAGVCHNETGSFNTYRRSCPLIMAALVLGGTASVPSQFSSRFSEI